MKHTKAFFCSLVLLVIACGSSGGSNNSSIGHGSWASCVTDADCPANEGCDTEGGSLTPGYCTPLCDTDPQCPQGYDCPGLIKNQPGECDEAGMHRGRGICDQFNGVAGPSTCK